MAPARMSKQAEEKIVRGVERVVDLVDDGLHPSAALLKVAQECDYPPGHIRLMAQAYNTGRTNHQRKSAADPFEKTALFPLADADRVLRELYPAQIKTAAACRQESVVSADYAGAPRWLARQSGMEKAARALPATPTAPRQQVKHEADYHAKKAFALLKDLEREKDQRRQKVAACRDKIAAELHQLDDWFRFAGHARLFPVISEQAAALWGTASTAVLAKVAQANPLLAKQARGTWYGPVDPMDKPWSLIGGCLAAVANYQREEKEWHVFQKQADEQAVQLAQTLLPPLEEPTRIRGSILTYEKRAFFDALTKTVPGVAATDAIRGILGEIKPTDSDKLKSDAYLAVTDPDHEAQLRKIRTRSILHNLLANDEFLSGEQPEKVTDLYNKISHLSPRAAEQPILMQALLRRYLAQGQVDPHDLDQLVGIEHKLKTIDEPGRAANLPRLPGGNLVDKGQTPPRRED